jgi:predicted MPP superfamily phosphohydrolase
MPFHLEFVLLRHDTLPRQGIIEGVHEVNGIPVFISRGIGCGALPVRLMSKPEASVVEIK